MVPPVAAAQAGARVVPLRRHRDFRRYWLAREVSIAGTLVTAVALPVLVYRLSGSPSLTALITVVEGLPYLVLGLFSGALSDRLDRRRVMVVADVVAALTIASVPSRWWLGLADRGARARRRLPQRRRHSSSSTARRSGHSRRSSGATVSGRPTPPCGGVGSLLDLGVPMLAGVLLAFVHPAVLLGVDALSFLLSAACVAASAPACPSHGPAGRRCGRGCCSPRSPTACGSSGGTRGCARRR